MNLAFPQHLSHQPVFTSQPSLPNATHHHCYYGVHTCFNEPMALHLQLSDEPITIKNVDTVHKLIRIVNLSGLPRAIGYEPTMASSGGVIAVSELGGYC